MVSTLPLSSNPPLVSRLEILRERENAWKRLEWKRKCSLDIIPSNWTFEFANGVFGYAAFGHPDAPPQSLNFFEPPSADSPSDQVIRAWTHDIDNLPVVDFVMDPANDLLVLLVEFSRECVPLRIFCR